MGTIHNLSSRFTALKFETIKQESLRETAPNIIPELNRQQLKSGQRADGQTITPSLSNVIYARDKENKNGLNGRSLLTPDLYNTGSFQSQITTTVTAKTIKTFSIDLKAAKLELKYSPYIYGANSQNLSKYATEDLQSVLIWKLKAATVG